MNDLVKAELGRIVINCVPWIWSLRSEGLW